MSINVTPRFTPDQLGMMADQHAMARQVEVMTAFTNSDECAALPQADRWRMFRLENALIELNEAMKDIIEHF